MSELEDILSQYDYPLSPELIAQKPAEPRDSSRLLVFDSSTGVIQEDVFSNLLKYLPRGSLLVFNDTKVIPARLPGYLPTGGRVELLCTKIDGRIVSALSERFLEDGEQIRFTDTISASVTGKVGNNYILSIEGTEDIRPLLHQIGTTPLPPYLKRSPLDESDRREKYQSVFAKYDGSIAAPTASLHFTQDILNELQENNIEIRFVTLHVNLGTFMPLTEAMVEKNELHEEHFEIPIETKEAVLAAKQAGRPVIAVGTTALRALESYFRGNKTTTRLFIREGYELMAVDGLITNFHVPKSSLMMLVAALIGRSKLLEIYTYAAKHGFRFLSFGDAMLLLPKRLNKRQA